MAYQSYPILTDNRGHRRRNSSRIDSLWLGIAAAALVMLVLAWVAA